MTTIIPEAELRKAITDNTFVVGGEPLCAEGIKYDFRLGPRVLKASFEGPVDVTTLTELEKNKITVEPGEVVFVLTEERLSLPDDILVVLTPKRKLSHDGIHVLGGLCVDPLYKGHLLIGMHNFSSEPFRIVPGKKLIAGIFHRLDKVEMSSFEAPEIEINDFPEELVRLINVYQPIRSKDLLAQIGDLRSELGILKKQVDDDTKWKNDFKGFLEKHSAQIEGLLESLTKEKENRVIELTNLDTKLQNQAISVSSFLGKANIVGVLLLLLLGAAIGWLVK